MTKEQAEGSEGNGRSEGKAKEGEAVMEGEGKRVRGVLGIIFQVELSWG